MQNPLKTIAAEAAIGVASDGQIGVSPMASGLSTMTEDDYLKSELTSDVKREFIDGVVYAMAGASRNHNILSLNLASVFNRHLTGRPCTTFMADMKVKMGRDYVYPDVLVDCSSGDGNDLFTASPVIVVEVLSGSTRQHDLNNKLIRYINIPSLKECVFIEQDVVRIEMLRQVTGWKYESYSLGDQVTFASIGLTLAVEEIYGRVDNNEMEAFRQGNF